MFFEYSFLFIFIRIQVQSITWYRDSHGLFDYEEKEKITPIGTDLDAYNSWVKSAKDRFIEKKNDLFATCDNDESK